MIPLGYVATTPVASGGTYSCLSGTSYDIVTDRCVAVPTCPSGTSFDTAADRCVAAPTCQSGFFNGANNLVYNYDQIGNILNKEGISYTYGTRPHAVTSLSNGKNYTYDANGNIITAGQQNITYDYDNMPTSIGTTSFTYDGSGRRIKKSSPGGTTVYIDKLYECTGGVCTKYIFAGNERIASKSGQVVLYYHPDHQGSTSVVTNATGTTEERITYYPFGSTKTDDGGIRYTPSCNRMC